MNVWIQFIYFNPCFTQVLLSFLKIHLYKHKQGIFIILNHEKKKKKKSFHLKYINKKL